MNRLLEWIKKDYLLIIVSLIFLFTMLYVLNTQGDYQNQCNTHWRESIQENCKVHRDLCAMVINYNQTLKYDVFTDFNKSYRLIGG